MKENDISIKKEKQGRINKEMAKLKQTFSKMDVKTKKAVHSLVVNAAFMIVTLEDLQEDINLNGVTEEYQNGKDQFGIKKSAAVEVYNTMIKNHLAVMKQLTDLIAKNQENEDSRKDDDGFDSFVKNK